MSAMPSEAVKCATAALGQKQSHAIYGSAVGQDLVSNSRQHCVLAIVAAVSIHWMSRQPEPGNDGILKCFHALLVCHRHDSNSRNW